MKRFQIIVEGDADKKFFADYYHHIFGEKAPKAVLPILAKTETLVVIRN